MSPEYDPKGWIKMFRGERIRGQGGVINGPARLDISFSTEQIKVHTGAKDVYIPGSTYEDVLQKIIDDSKV